MSHAIAKDKIKERPEDDVAAEEESLKNDHSSRWSQGLEKFSCTHIGQFMMKAMDRILNVVEDTAKWSVPQDDNDTQLNRPLPWIFFLSLIVILRFVRLWLSVGYFIVGCQPVTSLSVVQYIQALRRRLRAIRFHGRREIMNREVDNSVTERPSEDVKNNRTLTEVFSKVEGMLNQQQYRKPAVTLVEDKEVEQKPNRTGKRSLEDLCDGDLNDLSLSEMFYKYRYLDKDSENDSDYVPYEEDDSFTSLISSSRSPYDEARQLNKSSATENDMSDISAMEQEEQEIKEEAKDEETKGHSKPEPLLQDHLENHLNVDSSNKEIQMPKGNDEVDAEETKPAPEVAIQVAPESVKHTPQEHVVVTQRDDPILKPTPSYNDALPEADISRSYQDIHSIFHPAPIVKAGSVEALRSTLPATVEPSEASGNETSDIPATGNQKKNHTNHSKNYHYYNGKNRSKARRS